jgi:glycine cleavage system aminomethyltransferase T
MSHGVPTRVRHPALHPNVRRSPYFPATEAAGAVEYLIYNHMYMPIDYGRAPEEDYTALMTGVTLWDVGAERQTEVRGPDALAFADSLSCRDLSLLEVGGCRYTMVCDEGGRIMTECIVLRVSEDVVWFSHGDVDLLLWARGLALGGGTNVEVSEPDVAPLQIQGPRSIDVLRSVAGSAAESLEPFTCVNSEIQGIDVVVSRTGWSGELGYEMYPRSSERALDLWRALVDAGERHGMLVTGPNLIRACERGITDTHYFVGAGMTPFEAGAGWAVDLDAGPFVGRDALRAEAARVPARRSVGLVAVEPEPLPRFETFWPVDDQRGERGHVRWTAQSIALGRPIAIALVDAGVKDGDSVRIRHPSGEALARVTGLPIVGKADPSTASA